MNKSNNVLRNIFTQKPEIDEVVDCLTQTINSLIGTIEQRQLLYHPVFGKHSLSEVSYRKNILDRNCKLVANNFNAIKNKCKVRIVDVGANSGYVSHVLADSGFSVVGLEINPDNLRLAQLISKSESNRARFYNIDIFDFIKKDFAFFEEVDVILFFNVLHQIVFVFGLEEVKRILGYLSKKVDFIFVELAKREDYSARGLDICLPWSPEEFFKYCGRSTIVKIAASPRPVYMLKRNLVQIGTISVVPEFTLYSENTDENINRKYYFGEKNFVKIYRDNVVAAESRFELEVASLLKLSGCGVSPEVMDWCRHSDCFVIEMKRIHGVTLLRVIENTPRRLDINREISSLLKINHICNEKVGYHNDINAHNIIMREDHSLVVLDFELVSDFAKVDPFATLLWGMRDILDGRATSYQMDIHRRLFLPTRECNRVDKAFYPSFDSCSVPDKLKPLIDDLYNAVDWPGVIAKWYNLRSSFFKNTDS